MIFPSPSSFASGRPLYLPPPTSMQNVQYLDNSQQYLSNHYQNTDDSCLPESDVQHYQYFNAAGELQHFDAYASSLADPSSLPASAFMHPNPLSRRNSMRPQPPDLQIQNQMESNGYMMNSPFPCYEPSSGSPQTFLTPTTPTRPSIYMNNSAADSMTSFSPSSTSSGELESAEGISPSGVNAPSLNINSNEVVATGSTSAIEGKKRNSRRIWTHSLEKYIFTPHEIATLGTPHRRTIYSASLEAHIDRLHSQLLGVGFYPVHFDALEMYRGLNCKIAKGMVAGLQHDFIQVRRRLLEIERATNNAREMAAMRANHERIEAHAEDQGNADQFGQT